MYLQPPKLFSSGTEARTFSWQEVGFKGKGMEKTPPCAKPENGFRCAMICSARKFQRLREWCSSAGMQFASKKSVSMPQNAHSRNWCGRGNTVRCLGSGPWKVCSWWFSHGICWNIPQQACKEVQQAQQNSNLRKEVQHDQSRAQDNDARNRR